MSSFSINRVVLIGRLARDPDLLSLPSGTSLCRLRVVCSSAKKDAGSGEYLERPNFFDVNAYAGAADSAGRYLRKGNRVAIDGRLQWREWKTADGQRRQTVRIVADTMLFLDGFGGRRGDHQTSSLNETARETGHGSGGIGHTDGDEHDHDGNHDEGARHDDPDRGELARLDEPDEPDEPEESDLDLDLDGDVNVGVDIEPAVDPDADTITDAITDASPVSGMELVF